jgi:hypothetical protein
VTSFAAATFASSPLATVAKGGAGLMACNYDSAKSFAQQPLQYLESMEVDRKGNRFSSFNSLCNFLIFADFILHYLCSHDCQSGGSQQGAL